MVVKLPLPSFATTKSYVVVSFIPLVTLVPFVTFVSACNNRLSPGFTQSGNDDVSNPDDLVSNPDDVVPFIFFNNAREMLTCREIPFNALRKCRLIFT
ncbi:hypothetical protein HanIR_Chr04g0191031 [Helianthus annuus]|nr:hypothetical protein HanIR_Chr04g0191031 [Helianthus annuus]